MKEGTSFHRRKKTGVDTLISSCSHSSLVLNLINYNIALSNGGKAQFLAQPVQVVLERRSSLFPQKETATSWVKRVKEIDLDLRDIQKLDQ